MALTKKVAIMTCLLFVQSSSQPHVSVITLLHASTLMSSCGSIKKKKKKVQYVYHNAVPQPYPVVHPFLAVPLV